MRPNFLFIGPDKSGSSWLFDALEVVDDVYVAPAKDLYFFDRFYWLGWGWYESHFRVNGDAAAVGEICHDYLFSPIAAKRIANDLPDVKLIVSLREPVERAFSHYLYLKRSGLVKGDFLSTVEAVPEVLEKSCYGKHLECYFSLFDRAQVLVCWFDVLQKNPIQYLNNILEFIGAKPVDFDPVGAVVRPASVARWPTVARLAKGGAAVARQLGMANMVAKFKHNDFVDKSMYRRFAEEDRPVITPKEREAVGRLMEGDIRLLEKLLHVELPDWPRRASS